MVSEASLAQGTRRSGDRCTTGTGGEEATVGLLEALSEAASSWTCMEPQAGASCVLRSEPEFTEANEATIAEEAAPTSSRARQAERDLGRGLHGRCALRRPSVPDLQRHRRGQSRSE